MSQNGICIEAEPVNFINTYIKYVTEKSHKKIVHYVKKIALDSIVCVEQFTGRP